ncbi:MAG: P-II family nitrogen regulator [Huintestinicola sp.]
MKSVRAVIRPEKVFEVLEALSDKGFHAVTRISILGRGKQRGLKVGTVYYDEIPKEMLEIVVEDEDCSKVVEIIEKSAKTMTDGKQGSHGDGKIFISNVERVVTVSSGDESL